MKIPRKIDFIFDSQSILFDSLPLINPLGFDRNAQLLGFTRNIAAPECMVSTHVAAASLVAVVVKPPVNLFR